MLAGHITLTEAAERAGLAPVTLRQAAQQGKLRAELVGTGRRAIWITTPADLETYLRRHARWRPSRDLPAERPPTLTDREWEILQLRARDRLTYRAIADRLGVSPSRVGQVIAHAEAKLRYEPAS